MIKAIRIPRGKAGFAVAHVAHEAYWKEMSRLAGETITELDHMRMMANLQFHCANPFGVTIYAYEGAKIEDHEPHGFITMEISDEIGRHDGLGAKIRDCWVAPNFRGTSETLRALVAEAQSWCDEAQVRYVECNVMSYNSHVVTRFVDIFGFEPIKQTLRIDLQEKDHGRRKQSREEVEQPHRGRRGRSRKRRGQLSEDRGGVREQPPAEADPGSVSGTRELQDVHAGVQGSAPESAS